MFLELLYWAYQAWPFLGLLVILGVVALALTAAGTPKEPGNCECDDCASARGRR